MQRLIKIAKGRNGRLRPCTWMNLVQFIAYREDCTQEFYVCSHCGEDCKALGLTIMGSFPVHSGRQVCRIQHENGLRCLDIGRCY